MIANRPFPIIERPTQDDRVLIQGGWDHFKLIRQGCALTSGARLFYFDGTIEIVMPGCFHEIFSHAIGVLLTNFLAHQGILFFAIGSADQEREGIAAAQPDQSYCIGSQKAIPDLSIEIVFSSGGIRKLDRYKAIGVPEVWFWEDGTLMLYRLREQGYESIDRSELEELQDLDLAIFKRHIMMAETDLGSAVRSFNAYLFQ